MHSRMMMLLLWCWIGTAVADPSVCPIQQAFCVSDFQCYADCTPCSGFGQNPIEHTTTPGDVCDIDTPGPATAATCATIDVFCPEDTTCGPDCASCTGYTMDPAGHVDNSDDTCEATPPPLPTPSDCLTLQVFCPNDNTCGDNCAGCTGFTADPANLVFTNADSCEMPQPTPSDCDTAQVFCPNDNTCVASCAGCTGYTRDPEDADTVPADSCAADAPLPVTCPALTVNTGSLTADVCAGEDGCRASSIFAVCERGFFYDGADVDCDASGSWAGSAMCVPIEQEATCSTYCTMMNQYCPSENWPENCMTSCGAYAAAADASAADTFPCRVEHLMLAYGDGGDANVHCPHAGPTGGGVCVSSGGVSADPDFVPLFGSPAKHMFHVVLKNYTAVYNLVSDCDVQISCSIFGTTDQHGAYLNQWVRDFYFMTNMTRVTVSTSGAVIINGKQIFGETDMGDVRVSMPRRSIIMVQVGNVEYEVRIRGISDKLVAKARVVYTADGIMDPADTNWEKLELTLTKGTPADFTRRVHGLIGYSVRFSNLDLVQKMFPGSAEDYWMPSGFSADWAYGQFGKC